jgi:hypothetical protein
MVVATKAQLDYTVLGNGLLNHTALAALMNPSAVPPPVAELNALGCTVFSDTVIDPGGFPDTITRRLTVLFKNTEATATATRDTSAGAGPIKTLTLTGNGQTFGCPPIVQLSDSTSTPTKTARVHATLQVDAINVLTGGALYASPVVTLVGGLAPGGVPATAHATVGGGGVITGIVVDTPGGPYEYPPLVVITQAFGGGATAVADLNVGALVLDDPGDGYVTPVVSIIDFFIYTWPIQGSDQRQPFFHLLNGALKRAVSCPVTAVAPILIP